MMYDPLVERADQLKPLKNCNFRNCRWSKSRPRRLQYCTRLTHTCSRCRSSVSSLKSPHIDPRSRLCLKCGINFPGFFPAVSRQLWVKPILLPRIIVPSARLDASFLADLPVLLQWEKVIALGPRWSESFLLVWVPPWSDAYGEILGGDSPWPLMLYFRHLVYINYYIPLTQCQPLTVLDVIGLLLDRLM